VSYRESRGWAAACTLEVNPTSSVANSPRTARCFLILPKEVKCVIWDVFELDTWMGANQCAARRSVDHNYGANRSSTWHENQTRTGVSQKKWRILQLVGSRAYRWTGGNAIETMHWAYTGRILIHKRRFRVGWKGIDTRCVYYNHPAVEFQIDAHFIFLYFIKLCPRDGSRTFGLLRRLGFRIPVFELIWFEGLILQNGPLETTWPGWMCRREFSAFLKCRS